MAMDAVRTCSSIITCVVPYLSAWTSTASGLLYHVWVLGLSGPHRR